MAGTNLPLAGDKYYNLDGPIEVAMILGLARDFANIAAVGTTLRYPGKILYDEDLAKSYIIGADVGRTAYELNNVHIQVSENGSSWTAIQSYSGTSIKYIRFSVNGGIIWTNTIPVSTAADLSAYDAHIADTDNPHEVIASQVEIDESHNLGDWIESVDEHISNTNSPNPHGLTGDVINLSNEDSTAISEAIGVLETDVAGKIPKVTGGSSIANHFATLGADGTFVSSADVSLDGNFNLILEMGLFVAGTANTSVQSFTTSDNEIYALASEEGDKIMDLVIHDKFHFTINHATTIGLIAEDSRLIGLPFTIILKGGTTGGTVSFEDIPWGADFDDIVLGVGDIWMVTGYVYSLNQYLVKAIEF